MLTELDWMTVFFLTGIKKKVVILWKTHLTANQNTSLNPHPHPHICVCCYLSATCESFKSSLQQHFVFLCSAAGKTICFVLTGIKVSLRAFFFVTKRPEQFAHTRERERDVNCRREKLSREHMTQRVHTEICSRGTSQRRDRKQMRKGRRKRRKRRRRRMTRERQQRKCERAEFEALEENIFSVIFRSDLCSLHLFT